MTRPATVYVIEGPRWIGGILGHLRTLLKGEFAIVKNGELAGGNNVAPIQLVPKIFASRLTAEDALSTLRRQTRTT